MQKYLILDEEQYNSLLESIGEGRIHEGTGKTAQGAAVDLVDAANEAEPGVQHSVVLLAYAGALWPEIKRQVKTNFVPGRTIVRRSPEEIAAAKAEKEAKRKANPNSKRGRPKAKK